MYSKGLAPLAAAAAVTMTTALVSLLTDRRVHPHTAMTGEITLSGNVLPVGGIKEKVLAAKRAEVAALYVRCPASRGNVTVKIEPWPSTDETSMRPPIALTQSATIASPRPMPSVPSS